MKDLNKSIQEKQSQIDKLNRDIEELKKDLETQDFQKIIYKDKEFRIYKWEDKQIKDFKIPEGFDFAEFSDFVELYDKKKIELAVWKYYYVKHFSKIQQNKEYGLSGLYLSRDLVFRSVNDDLASSNSVGRVCVSRKIKAVKE
jgi:TolA-binding protein